MKKEEQLLSFHGDKAIKEKYLSRVLAHQKADEIVKGQYWEDGKGCAVGCTIHSDKHDKYDTELGITWRLALVQDSIFENLQNGQAKEFPYQFLKTLPVGVDTNLIFKKFVIWNLIDPKEGLITVVKNEDVKAALKEVGETYKKSLKEEIPQSEWKRLFDKYYSASASAYAYAYASAYAYAYAYASAPASASASASATAYAYAYASASAYAYAVEGTDSWETKKNARILRMRDKLLQLFKAAKPVK